MVYKSDAILSLVLPMLENETYPTLLTVINLTYTVSQFLYLYHVPISTSLYLSISLSLSTPVMLLSLNFDFLWFTPLFLILQTLKQNTPETQPKLECYLSDLTASLCPHCSHVETNVRKQSIFCLVELLLIFGTDRIDPLLASLTVSQVC